MEPRIQYTKTSDGVSIAFWTVGEGTPLVYMPLLFSHIQLEWQIAECRRWYERLAEKRKLVRYDPRGFGLSERNVSDYSLDAFMLDLEAVVDRLGLERFALCGPIHFGPVAIAYAARKPERVSHLVLWCTYARASDWLRSPQSRAARSLIGQDWTFFTETVAHTLLGWSAGEPARRYAALIRESFAPEAVQTFVGAINQFDVTALLPQVTAPTLVLDRPQYLGDVDRARGVASRVPDSRLALLEGEAGAPYFGDMEAVLVAIDEFLGEGEPSALPQGTAIILFADIVDSTALTERLGDAAFRERARELDGALRAIIRDNSGTPIEGKLLGDGVLAVFTSARQAIEAALACGKAGDGAGLPLHLGLHAGDVIREENNVYGGAVNIASRVAALSAPGEVLVSETVRSLARTSAGVRFEDRGEHELKGVGEPVRVWAVRAGEA